MKPQSYDPIYGNGFLHTTPDNQADLRHNQLKAFFYVQVPLLTVPNHKKCPNFKVDHFFKWIKYINIIVWHPGKNLAGGYRNVSFKGQHVDTIMINFKKAGCRLQDDALCDDGYTIKFYFQNNPSPEKY